MLGNNKTDSTHPSEGPGQRESKAMMALDSNSENLAGSLGKSSRFDDDQNDSSDEVGVIGGGRAYEVNNSTHVNVT